MNESTGPIGVFDSGVGGLTVFKEISDLLPEEKIIYLGDTARVPYGTKSPETVIKYALQDSRFLIDKKAKLIVIACNTASAVSLSALQGELQVPVIGVIEPGARAAVEETSTKRIGVIGTEATVNSGAYTEAIHTFDRSIQVTSLSCPLFVPLSEEGWTSNSIAEETARTYLEHLKGSVDTLVLGCTHYPLLKEVIQKAVGKDVTLVCSAEETARSVKEELTRMDLFSQSGGREFYVSDNPDRFTLVGRKFLGKDGIENVRKITIDNY